MVEFRCFICNRKLANVQVSAGKVQIKCKCGTMNTYEQGLSKPNISIDVVIQHKDTDEKFVLPAGREVPENYRITNLPPFGFPIMPK